MAIDSEYRQETNTDVPKDYLKSFTHSPLRIKKEEIPFWAQFLSAWVEINISVFESTRDAQETNEFLSSWLSAVELMFVYRDLKEFESSDLQVYDLVITNQRFAQLSYAFAETLLYLSGYSEDDRSSEHDLTNDFLLGSEISQKALEYLGHFATDPDYSFKIKSINSMELVFYNTLNATTREMKYTWYAKLRSRLNPIRNELEHDGIRMGERPLVQRVVAARKEIRQSI